MLIHIHNIWFYGEILKIITFYHFDSEFSDPRFPPFYYILGANLGSLLYGDVSVMTRDYIERKRFGGYVQCMSTWHKSESPIIRHTISWSGHASMVIFPITLIQLEHLSVMAAYVVLYIGLVNMVLKTAYAREIPGRVKGNRQYSRSFVYYRRLACSTVSLTGDRGRGDDS